MSAPRPGPARRLARHVHLAARRRVASLLERLLSGDDGRRILHEVTRGFEPPPAIALPPAPWTSARDFPVPPAAGRVPVFITARFRSGSTLLWRIFRHLPDATAYYEPHNARRWFDAAHLDRRIDPTHVGIDDYWREYAGMEDLAAWYRPTWPMRQLVMSASCPDPDMRAYLDALITRAPGRPVLQFNHVDFRLPWLLRHYPQARLIHLYRHPRDQWMSSLGDAAQVPREARGDDFRNLDHYYLLPWARDLAAQFPFLDPRHEPRPYRLFYYIWRLSHAVGVQHAHLSIAYESLTAQPAATLATVLQAAHWPGADVTALATLVAPRRESRWADWAPAAWFDEHEAACEAVLARELGRAWAPSAAVLRA